MGQDDVSARERARDLSARRIIGFACTQAFTFFLFYMGTNQGLSVGGSAEFERVDLLFALLFMGVGFALLRAMPREALAKALSKPPLYMYAVVMVFGSLVPLATEPVLPPVLLWLAAGLLFGVPYAFLLTAWGRAFGRVSTAISVPEVFIGSLVAALLCLVFTFTASSEVTFIILCALPLASVVNIETPADEGHQRPAVMEAASVTGRSLSLKILAGTLLFGMASGLLETFATEPGGPAAPHYVVSMLLFGAFLIGALTLLLSDAFGRGAALNKSYRLAVFIMMGGVLLAPWPLLAASAMPGQAITLAGYLGLEVVLISLFLVLANITSQDAALGFSKGFAVLFGGEFAGVLVADLIGLADPSVEISPYLVPALAGLLVLLSYVFLFTERDFDELSQIVTVTDRFDDTCASIVAKHGLSARESEILAYALRGRTSERIAQELVISKSTVDTHLRRIYAKCEVHSRQELLDLAERQL